MAVQLEKEQQQNLQRLNEQRQAGQRVDSMQSNQQELSIMIQDLQKTLISLKTDYQQLQETAKLTSDKFANATEQAKQFQRELIQAKQQLKDSQATAANLQRALRTKGTEVTASSEFDSFQLSKLADQLLGADPDKQIGLVQKSDGSIFINIPLEKLFVPGTVQLSPEAANIINPIAQSLISFEDRRITVLGHSDERRITSTLAEKYPTNWELSSIRASKVLLALIEQGVEKDHLMAAGKAATNPVRDESIESAWEINRRIEIIIQ